MSGLVWLGFEIHVGRKGLYIILIQLSSQGVKEGGSDGCAAVGMQSWVELVEEESAVCQDKNFFFISDFFDAAAVCITWNSANGQNVFTPSLAS